MKKCAPKKQEKKKNESEEIILLKTQALLRQWEWIEKTIKSLPITKLNDLDKTYYCYIVNNLRKFTSKEIVYW